MSTKIIRKTIKSKPKARRAKVTVQQITQKTSKRKARGRRTTRKPKLRNYTSRKGGMNGENLQGGYITNPRTAPRSEVYAFDERITAVTGNVLFAVKNIFAINPANTTTFPWLSNIAKLYERYKFEELKVCFQHDVSQFATQGQTGLLYLSAFYDAASAAPTSAVHIADSDPRVFGMPNENLCLNLNHEFMHPGGIPKFCRPGLLPGQSDIKEYDAGNIFYAATGTQNTSEVGFLQIKGRVRLYTRMLEPSLVNAPVNNSVSIFGAFNLGMPNATLGVVPFSYSGFGYPIDGLAMAGNTTGDFVPKAGNYLMDLWFICYNNTPGTPISVAVDFVKDSASILPGGIFTVDNDGETANNPTISESLHLFVQATGSNHFQLQLTPAYGAGAMALSAATIRWTAI